MDRRKVMQPETGKTFEPIALWATNTYHADIMAIAFEGDDMYPPPTDRRYYLELLYVPDEVEGAPQVGTIWEVPAGGLFYVTMPTYRWWEDKGGSIDDPHGYLFSFTITPVAPEPSGLMAGGLLGAAWIAGRRRG